MSAMSSNERSLAMVRRLVHSLPPVGALARWFLDQAERGEAVEHRVDGRAGLAGTGRIAQHGCEEVFGPHRKEPEWARGPDGSGSADLSEQGDLPEPLPRTQGGDHPPVSDHLGLARLDHEVAVA